jgi:hypothetical protein
MTRTQGLLFTASATLLTAAAIAAATFAAAPSAPTQPPAPTPAASPTTQPTPPTPKPISENVQKGLQWLVAHQNPNDGGWSQGEESQAMGNSMAPLADKSNVGDTCMAVLALLHSGSTPTDGPYAANIKKGIDFVVAEINKAPADGLTVTSVNGTRIQGKLGPNIDTFLASLMLGEIRNKMPGADRKMTIAALDKVMDKIEKNQKSDGRIAEGGWAPSLGQGIAAKGANIAAENGAKVSEGTLHNFEKFSAQRQVAAATPVAGPLMSADADVAGRSSVATARTGPVGGVATIAGSAAVTADDAGVPLYAQASNLSALQNAQNRLDSRYFALQDAVNGATTAPADKPKLEAELKEVEGRRTENGRNLDAAAKAAAQQVQDARFIAGFGSNGGEEFLSYLNLGETLIKQGGDAWTKWDEKITANLNNIQNKDGSWSGQHCITGRTFCTSAALMVLTLDREPTAMADQLKRR